MLITFFRPERVLLWVTCDQGLSRSISVSKWSISPCKMSLLAIKYHSGHLEILNQLLLPHESLYEEISCVEEGWQAIRSMKVRSGGWASFVEGLFLCAPLVWQEKFFYHLFVRE